MLLFLFYFSKGTSQNVDSYFYPNIVRIALTPSPRRSKRTLLKFELSIPESDFEMILQFEYSYMRCMQA